MIDTTHYADLLQKERTQLEEELGKLGTHDPKNPESWELTAPALDIMQADENEAADMAEEILIDSAVLSDLENRYRHVRHAEQKILDGTFGTCEVCGNAIETERLDANPAARTCKADIAKENGLSF